MPEHRTFIPRTEAHVVPPGQPLEPISAAVEELLTAIEGTIRATGQDVARCFVVAGERGTGKTTVLMNAAAHCNRRSPNSDSARWQALAKRVRWLDILDVEPVMPSANFLTILLVAVRRVLERADEGKRRASLLEDRASDARGRLDSLISDSALVWEEIEENTTRERAHRQVAAAEIYLEFSRRLTEVFAEVGKALSERESGPDVGYVFVLPLDNIDRSAEHLKAIFKLAQLVTCEHLYLVLAADRAELNLFLERAYWKEAVSGSMQAKGEGEEDEALATARRQAAATLRKILPPSNRIEIKLNAPDKALEFCADPDSERPLRQLLDEVPLGTAVNTKSDAWEPRSLLELLEIAPDLFAEERRSMTALGRAALHLSARSLLDLWLIVRSSLDESEPAKRSPIHRAIRIVRGMLRLAAAESTLPHWAAELLQERIVTRTVDDGTRLVLRVRDEAPYVALKRLRSLDAILVDHGPANETLDSTFEVRTHGRHEFLMSVHQAKHGSADVDQSVIAWFLLLHDLLIQAPEPLVINPPKDMLDVCGPSVETRWTAWIDDEPVPLAFRWPAPNWPTVYDHVLMEEAWRQRLAVLERREASIQTLAWNWFDVVLWVGKKDRSTWRADYGIDTTKAAILGELERQPESDVSAFRPRSGTDLRRYALATWLENDLPRFFTGELGVVMTPTPAGFAPSFRGLKHRIKVALRKGTDRTISDKAIVDIIEGFRAKATMPKPTP